MNAAVQCLAHTAPLKRVFLDHAYKADINMGNINGSKGKVARAFGDVTCALWQVCVLAAFETSTVRLD